MDQGRYEEAAGEEGGFRKFVKDPEKQRELEESGAVAAGLDIAGRNLERAAKDYESSPDVPDAINRYAQLLRAVGTPESLDKAHEIFMKGHTETGQYRFRASAGDIRIEQARDRLIQLQKQQAAGSNDVATALEEARGTLLELRHVEYTQRVKEYPTDRRIRQQLGEVVFDQGRYDDAMPCFQEAKDDPQLRVRAGYMLGRSFAAQEWHDMAIQEYKEALERVEPGDKNTELSVRYDLMVSLMEFSRQEKSLELAREALDICSSIARKDITYRDIRACRMQADKLIKELSRPDDSDE
jgi:tetratricopeptide (TPR) repeat protein